jgi:hypothetical protein
MSRHQINEPYAFDVASDDPAALADIVGLVFALAERRKGSGVPDPIAVSAWAYATQGDPGGLAFYRNRQEGQTALPADVRIDGVVAMIKDYLVHATPHGVKPYGDTKAKKAYRVIAGRNWNELLRVTAVWRAIGK